jgi:ribosomal subunit interface protein
MTITDEQREYIDKKVNRLRRMCPKIDELSFTLTKAKLHYEAEASFRAGRLAAQAVVTAAQPLEVIDALIDKLEIQLTKAKERLANKKEAGREKANQRAGIAAEGLDEDEEEEAEVPSSEEALEA